MTTHTQQQTLANALNARASRIAGVGLSLVILVGGVLGYHSASAPQRAQAPSIQPAASSPYTEQLAQTGTWERLAAGADESPRSVVALDELSYVSAFLSEEQLQRYLDSRQARVQVEEATGSVVGPSELAYVSAFLSEEQLQRYLERRQRVFQADATTCRPVGPDELDYVGALLNDAQLPRYLAGRQCPPAR